MTPPSLPIFESETQFFTVSDIVQLLILKSATQFLAVDF
jgi:hypothetical protein